MRQIKIQIDKQLDCHLKSSSYKAPYITETSNNYISVQITQASIPPSLNELDC